MDEYINKEEIIRHLCLTTGCSYHDVVIGTIMDFPATDIQPVDRWISVKNKFPNDGERVIACTVDKMVLEMKFDKRRECWGRLDIDGMHLFGKSFVTRWMPLPEPPKDSDTND